MSCYTCKKESTYTMIGFLIVKDNLVGKSPSDKEFCAKCCKKQANNPIVDEKLLTEKARVMYLIEMV